MSSNETTHFNRWSRSQKNRNTCLKPRTNRSALPNFLTTTAALTKRTPQIWASRNNQWWSRLHCYYHIRQRSTSFVTGLHLRTESASERNFQILPRIPKNFKWKNNDKAARRLYYVWTIKIAEVAHLLSFKTDSRLKANSGSMSTSTSLWTEECQNNPKLELCRGMSLLKTWTNAIRWLTKAHQTTMISSICLSTQATPILCERNQVLISVKSSFMVTSDRSRGGHTSNSRLEAEGALWKLKTQLEGVHRQVSIIKIWACWVDRSGNRENKRGRPRSHLEWSNWGTKMSFKS